MTNKILMTNKEYHEAEGVGSTLLKSIAQKTVIHAIETPFEGSKDADLGGGLHCNVLTPESFDQEFIEMPKCDRRTKAGKEIYNEFVDKAQGKTILDSEQMEAVKAMTRSILNHPTAQYMLKGGQAEYSYFTKCPETGLTLKCRPDYVNKNTLIDIKSARDASPRGFAKASGNLMYHVQAAFYMDVYNMATHSNVKEFYFIAVENTAPWGCAVYKVDPFDIEHGRSIYMSALKKLNQYYQEADKEGFLKDKFIYGEGILNLTLPNWAYSA